MLDALKISALHVKTYIGIHAWEQKILQQLQIDICIPADFSQCQDDLTRTFDYAAICQRVTDYVESHRFNLIETVAENIALLLKEDFSVPTLSVTVYKPYAIKNAGNISVTVTR